jgi:ribosomal protein S27AE
MATTQADACLRCGTALSSAGIEQFRVGGTSGGWKLLFGELAEVSEEMLALELLVCTNCGYVEFRRPA